MSLLKIFFLQSHLELKLCFTSHTCNWNYFYPVTPATEIIFLQSHLELKLFFSSHTHNWNYISPVTPYRECNQGEYWWLQFFTKSTSFPYIHFNLGWVLLFDTSLFFTGFLKMHLILTKRVTVQATINTILRITKQNDHTDYRTFIFDDGFRKSMVLVLGTRSIINLTDDRWILVLSSRNRNISTGSSLMGFNFLQVFN